MADFDYAGWASQATKEAEDAAYALNPRGIGSDVKTALKQGLLNLPSAATGLLDIPAGLLGANRPFSTAATKLGELTGIEPAKWAKILDQDYSRATKEGKREIQQVWDDPATSGWDVAKSYASNPRVTGLSAVESLPSMAAGWGVGGVAGKLGGIASASARAAVGEGSVMAGQGMSNISPDVDPQKAALAALAIGAGGAAISGGSANLLGRLGVRDIDTLATGGAQRLASEGVPPMPMYKRVPVGMVQEGLVEEGSQSALETGVQNIAEDKPLTQGMARNVIEGTLAGTPLGAIGGALPPALAKPPMATPEDVAERVAGNKLALEAGKRWQDMVKEKGITAPEDDLATQRSIGLMAQAAADQKQIDEERAGAAAGKARDARLADVGQQFQALNIPDPANELAAQRVGMRPTPTESPYAVAPGRDIFNFPAAPEPAAEPPIPDAAKTLDEAQRVLFGPRGGVAAEAVPPKAPTFASMQDAYMGVLPKLLEQAVAENHITPAEAAWHAEDFAQAQNKKQFEAAKAKFEEALRGTTGQPVTESVPSPAVQSADSNGSMGTPDTVSTAPPVGGVGTIARAFAPSTSQDVAVAAGPADAVNQVSSTATKENVNGQETRTIPANEGENASQKTSQEGLLKREEPVKLKEASFRSRETGDVIGTGPVHNRYALPGGWKSDLTVWEPGFTDTTGKFYTREEAAKAVDVPASKGGLRTEDFSLTKGITQANTAPTKEELLDDNQYVYHAVRNDEDIADISKNGLRPGTNLSDSKGQAFEGEGDTVLVFKKADVAVENKGYQNDLVATNEGAKPVAILKDTSVDVGGFTQNEWDAEASRIEAEAARIEAAQQAIADKYSVSLDDVIREGLRKKAEIVSPEDHKVLRKLDKQSDVMGADMDRLAAQDGVAPTTEQDVLNRYTQHGVPVFAHTPTISEDTQNANEPISTTQTDAAVQPSKKEQTSVTEANQTEQGQSEKEARETVSADLKRWDEKLGNRLTTSEIVSANPSVKTRETVPTEVNDVKSAIQAVLSLDPLDRTNRDELKLNLNYLAGVAADNKHTFGSSQDLQHIPEVVNDFLDEQEDLAVADGSPLQRMIGRARDRAKTSLAYVINNNEEIKKTDAQKSAELTKAANAVDAGQTLETEFDPSAPFDYGPEVTKELAIKDDAIEVLQRRSDAEPDNTKLAAGLVNARQQRNEYARKEQRKIESDRKASPATTAAGEEITPDMESEIAARKEATLERQARRLEMGTKGVDIATSNMKPGHLTSLLEHYGIDVSKGVTPEARKTLQTNLRRDVAAYLKDGPEAVPVEIRGAIKAATEDKKGEVRYSKVPKTAAERSTAAEVEADLKDFMKSGSLGRNVTVVQDAGALPAGVAKSVSVDDTTQAFVHNGHAYVIAGNIAKGNARAVFLHDVGGHLGLENILTKNQHRMLVDMVKAWAAREDGSQEHRFAKAALERVASAQTEDSQIGNETLTYFIEEAVQGGVNPTADNFKTELGRWFRVLWAAFKGAIRKLGMNPDKMTAQDIVDMAYGAARMEVHGTWHGTAADFRKFNHDYMGSGEGAQVRGWGSYLAQRAGIGKGYWSDDVARKKNPRSIATYPEKDTLYALLDDADMAGFDTRGEALAAFLYHPGYAAHWDVSPELQAAFEAWKKWRRQSSGEGNLMRTDVNVADNEWLDLDKPISEQSDVVRAAVRNAVSELNIPPPHFASYNAEDFYRDVAIAAYEKEHGEEPLQTDKSAADKLASQWLDKHGVKGNRFLDSTSRGPKDTTLTFEGKSYTRDQLKDEAHKAQDEGRYNDVHKFVMLRSIARQGLAATVVGIQDKLSRNPGYDVHTNNLAWLKENGDKIKVTQESQADTHNFVVFNDKNIQRVASLRGADREKVQFSKAIPADRVEMAQKYGGKSGVQVVADTAYTVRKIADWITPLPDLIRKYGVEGKLPTVKEWYAAVQAKEEERNRIKQKAEVIAKIIEPLSDTQRGLLNELGYDSTFQQKWGYDPKFERLNKDGKMEAVKVTVDPEMKARFDKMEKDHPEVVKALKQMFAYGEEVRQDLRSVLRASGLSDSFIVANQLEGPYMPLRRFGNFAVVLKSDKLIAAEKAAEGTTPSSAASKLVDKLKMNADDFAFSRFETAGQAAVFLHEQLATGKFNKDKKFSNTFPYGDELNTMTTIPQDVLQRVMAHIKADENMDSDAKKNMVENVKDIYRQTTEDRLARQAQQRRKYRHGADTDMIRSFMAQSEADAGFLSLLKHGGTINDAIYQVQREGEAGRQDLKAISDLIIAHHTEIQKVENTPIQDRLVALTSAMQLASSPSYHLSNMSQVFMVTMPKLAAVFNDYGGSYKAIMEGYKLYREITGGNIITGKTLDLESMTKPEHQGLKEALLHAVRRNLLDVGMDGDISQFNKFQTGYAVADGTSAVASKALYKLRQVSRGVELMNRIATVAASYNMYMERHKGEANAGANAQAFALEMTETTQGDMSNVAAPLALKLTPKVIGQYRKYQIMMVMFYADGFNKAFRSADPKERAIGRRMLAYKMFHTGMAAGVLGLPMINIVGPLFAALFGDDDEPKDFERMMRDTIGNQALADLLLHGPLQMMGLDTSAKLGDEKVFSIMPFTDFDISSKKGLALTTMGLLGGPAFGQASKMADGVGLMQQGAYYKGIEKMLPKGLEDAFKGFRLANEGYTLKNGDVMVTAEDINGVALAFQMVGLPSTDIKRMQWFQSQQIEIKKFYADREADLKRDYLDAKKSGDDTQEIKDDWRQVQEGKAKVRKYFNNVPTEMKARDMSALTDVVNSQHKRELKLQKSIPAAID